MQEIDIWRAAQQMIEMFGDDAVIRSALRADAMLDQGDIDGFRVWKRIAAASEELNKKSSAGEVH